MIFISLKICKVEKDSGWYEMQLGKREHTLSYAF